MEDINKALDNFKINKFLRVEKINEFVNPEKLKNNIPDLIVDFNEKDFKPRMILIMLKKID